MEQSYIQSIVAIHDISCQKEVKWTKLGIQDMIAKYSNTKKPIYKLVLDDKPISRNNNLLVTYKCITCTSINQISLNLFMRKVNREGCCCVVCRNLEESKRLKQSQFMKENATKVLSGEYIKKAIVKPKTMSLNDHLEYSYAEWANEDDDFRDDYFHHHLTQDDFERIRSRIKGIGNNKITDLSGWSYEPCYKVFNQTKYTPMMIQRNTEVVEKPLYISFACENCECIFIHRDLEVIKNKIKIFCKECSFTNKIFALRRHKMTNGESIYWQSIPEKRFIEWCEENSIPIKNGPRISYEFDNKQRTYRVDFELPTKKMLIEIKDNHCWHKQQVANGKFAAKEQAALDWASQNGYIYTVVFPKTMADLKIKLMT